MNDAQGRQMDLGPLLDTMLLSASAIAGRPLMVIAHFVDPETGEIMSSGNIPREYMVSLHEMLLGSYRAGDYIDATSVGGIN